MQIIFFVETVTGSVLRSAYFLRLYFWIDALATVRCPGCYNLHCKAYAHYFLPWCTPEVISSCLAKSQQRS